MLQYLAMLIMVHAGYSLMKWRKFLIMENQFNNFFIPTDILTQLLIAVALCVLVILSHTKKFKNIKDVSCPYTYDSIFRQTQFSGGNVLNSRAPALLNSLKTKMGAIQLQ